MDEHSRHRRVREIAAAFIVLLAVAGSVYWLVRVRNRNHPPALIGVVVQDNSDTRKQSPIADVEITSSENAVAPTKSNAGGFFKAALSPGVRRGHAVTLHFRNAKYAPFDLNTTVGDSLYVIRMVPLQTGEEELPGNATVIVSNVLVRYSTENTADTNIGTGVTTFQVANTGGLRCDGREPCSPDGKWKASIGNAALDAGPGNEYRNARVFCIAGPCPFTKVVTDNFTRGGRNISVAVLNWSDTTTFLFQAEVFRHQVNNAVRQSYPVVYGRTFNFSLPSAAEGPTLEAELNKVPIVFPLGPDAKLSWASCSVILGSRYSKSYRCELKQGYKFP